MFFTAFTRLFGQESTPVRAPASVLIEGLDRVESLPTFSDTTARAFALLNDPGASASDVAELVRRDAVLATSLLKLANSVAFRGRNPIDTLPKAARRLGIQGCRLVLTAIGVRDTFRAPTPATAVACDALHRHALFTGALAVRLGAAGGFGFRGEEFTAGLLHDIGRVVLCARAPDAFTRTDPLSFNEDAGILAGERAALNTDHCELGLRFARANALPQPIADAIRYHHTPEAAVGSLLVALTAAADELANHAQRERKLRTFQPDASPRFAHLRTLIGVDAMRDIRAALAPAVVGALRETRTLLRLTGS